MRNVTAEEVEKAAHEHGLGFVWVGECGICLTPVGYVFDDESVAWDGSCKCAAYTTPPQDRTFQDVADLINRTPDAQRPELAARFGIKEQPSE
jgi:hypothetical protein